jgi:hypothetical protein
MPTVEITLNRAGVAAPVQLAAIASSDVIASGLTAFATDTLANRLYQINFLGFKFVARK